MITKEYIFLIIFIYSINIFYLITCQITNDYDRLLSNELDYIEFKHIPSILHNDNVYLTVLYKCSTLTKRRISLSIRIERNFSVFRRYWFCQKSPHIQIRYVRVHLHRSLAYAFDVPSWPIEQGQLSLIMYNNEQENENEILKKIQHNVRFLPVYQRPSFRSIRWNPFIYKKSDAICLIEPEIVRIINYPLVLTGNIFGKYFVLPSYHDYGLRMEQQMRIIRPQFSIIFWLYIDEYCLHQSPNIQCAILQHLTFNNTQLTPRILLNQEGQIIVNMYGNYYDTIGTGARTIAKIPKKDWCRVAFIVNEYNWSIYINCLRTWNQPIKAYQRSPIYYYFNDEFATFVIGGSETASSFRGFVSQMDIYRRKALTYEQLPRTFDRVSIPYLPTIIRETNQCKYYNDLFQQCFEQFQLFNKRIQEKFTCRAWPFLLNKSNSQCSVIRTWKQEMLSSSTDVKYRIFRALRRRLMNSTTDVANKLFGLIMKLLENDDYSSLCDRIITWTEQAICYDHPSAHSLLATLYQFGLCGLKSNSSRALELLLSGALHNDRISLLALGHRHFYGFDGVPIDYDTAYVYYQQMAHTSKYELYNPQVGEVAMEHIRLTDSKLLDGLTFDKSDSFHWLKQQARLGVAAAQHRLGALLHAGGNGLTRNIQAAVEYFRLGAIQHDASSHFGYGLALLKGRGTKQNVSEAIRQIEKAVEGGFIGAQVALGYHAYEIEKNYTKAAAYWQNCYDRVHDAGCAHNLGIMWSAGHYPPKYIVDHVQAWQYYSFAARQGQIDSKIIVALNNARGGHPAIVRTPWIAASWARSAAESSSSIGTVTRKALQAYRDRRWHTSFLFYLQTALAGIEIGYFNSGYLCYELKELNSNNSFNCIEDFLNMYLVVHGDNKNIDSYALLNIADYYQWEKRNLTKVIELYLQLYQDGDPHGLYNLAQLEEEQLNETIPANIWSRIGIQFDENILTNRYRKLQSIYQFCRSLKIAKSDESYIPCTLAYLRISIMILFNEQFKIFITGILLLITTIVFLIPL